MNEEINKEIFKHEPEYSIPSQPYNPKWLWLIGLLGGVLPVLVLGTLNCKWLKFKKSATVVMALLGISFLLVEFLVLSLYIWTLMFNDLLSLGYILAYFLLHVLAITLGLLYYLMMKARATEHFEAGGSFRPILKHAFIWSIGGIFIEVLIPISVFFTV